MCESIVVVGAALSADVEAPTERVHSAPGARRGQSPIPRARSDPAHHDSPAALSSDASYSLR